VHTEPNWLERYRVPYRVPAVEDEVQDGRAAYDKTTRREEQGGYGQHHGLHLLPRTSSWPRQVGVGGG
jgi:hypothetical protein